MIFLSDFIFSILTLGVSQCFSVKFTHVKPTRDEVTL